MSPPTWLYWPLILPPSGTPWTPSDLTGTNLRLWLKADDGVYDATTGGNLITTDGTAVRRWEDQSGTLSSHPICLETNAPTYGANVLNGKPVIQFTSRALHRGGTPIYGSNPESIQVFLVGLVRGAGAFFDVDNYEPLIAAKGPPTFRPVGVLVGVLGITTTTTEYLSAWDSSSDTWQIISLRIDFPNDAIAVQRDGGVVNRTETRNFNASSYGTANKNITIGGRFTETTEVINGDLAEIVVVTNDATDDTRDRVTGYLAHKWGLQGNLPVDHPYKSSPPAP